MTCPGDSRVFVAPGSHELQGNCRARNVLVVDSPECAAIVYANTLSRRAFVVASSFSRARNRIVEKRCSALRTDDGLIENARRPDRLFDYDARRCRYSSSVRSAINTPEIKNSRPAPGTFARVRSDGTVQARRSGRI